MATKDELFREFQAQEAYSPLTYLFSMDNSYKRQAEQIADDIHQASAMLENSESVDKVMKYYYQLLQRDKNSFQQDLEENLPDFKPGGKGKQ